MSIFRRRYDGVSLCLNSYCAFTHAEAGGRQHGWTLMSWSSAVRSPKYHHCLRLAPLRASPPGFHRAPPPRSVRPNLAFRNGRRARDMRSAPPLSRPDENIDFRRCQHFRVGAIVSAGGEPAATVINSRFTAGLPAAYEPPPGPADLPPVGPLGPGGPAWRSAVHILLGRGTRQSRDDLHTCV